MKPRTLIRPEAIWLGALAAAGAALASFGPGSPVPAPGTAPGGVVPLEWRLNNPAPLIVPEEKANPAAIADKFAARVRAMEERAELRAYEGAPPVIPHTISGMNIQTCRACHAEGLVAGGLTARMASHTHLTNCTQCHVEQVVPAWAKGEDPGNTFVGFRTAGYGGTRAWTGAPPVIPHAIFMRTNCVSCHGEHGYDGWRPDHLSRTNCVQCHAPAAEFDQLSPAFGQAPRPFDRPSDAGLR